MLFPKFRKDRSFEFNHSLIQQIFMEHLLCVRPSSRCWGHNGEQNTPNSLFLYCTQPGGNDREITLNKPISLVNLSIYNISMVRSAMEIRKTRKENSCCSLGGVFNLNRWKASLPGWHWMREQAIGLGEKESSKQDGGNGVRNNAKSNKW